MKRFFFGRVTQLSKAIGCSLHPAFKLWHIPLKPLEIYSSRVVSIIQWIFRNTSDVNLVYVSDGLVSPLLKSSGRRVLENSRFDKIIIDQPFHDREQLGFEGEIQNYWAPQDFDSRQIVDISDLEVICVVTPNDTFLGTSITDFALVVRDLCDQFGKLVVISCPNRRNRSRLRALFKKGFLLGDAVEIRERASALSLKKETTLYVTGFTSFHLSDHSGKWFCTYYEGEYGEYLRPLCHFRSGCAVDLEQLPKRQRILHADEPLRPQTCRGEVAPIWPSVSQVANELTLLATPQRRR